MSYSSEKIISFFFEALCESAEPAAVLESLPVLPSRKTLEAAVAARLDVCLLFLAIMLVTPFP